jgi:hypothetical protein
LPLAVLNQLWACLLNNNLIILNFFNVKNIWFYITFSLTLSSTEPTCEFQFWNLFNSHVSCLHDQLVLFHYFNWSIVASSSSSGGCWRNLQLNFQKNFR